MQWLQSYQWRLSNAILYCFPTLMKIAVSSRLHRFSLACFKALCYKGFLSKSLLSQVLWYTHWTYWMLQRCITWGVAPSVLRGDWYPVTRCQDWHQSYVMYSFDQNKLSTETLSCKYHFSCLSCKHSLLLRIINLVTNLSISTKILQPQHYCYWGVKWDWAVIIDFSSLLTV